MHFYDHSLKPKQSPSDNDEQDHHNIEQDIECEEGSTNSKEYACFCT